jgi:hypothetical protein
MIMIVVGYIRKHDSTENDSKAECPFKTLRGLSIGSTRADVIKAYGNLDPSSWRPLNMLTNVIAEITPFMKERLANLTDVRTKFGAVVDEMAGIFKRTGATDVAIEKWSKSIKNPETATRDMWKSFIDGALELMGSRIKTLRDVYESGMGKPADFMIMNPKSREILYILVTLWTHTLE